MTKRNQARRKSDDKEFVVLTISRSRLRSEFGDAVADQMNGANLKDFAEKLGNFYQRSTHDWKRILSKYFGFDLLDDAGVALVCKRCQHHWRYRGRKIATPAYPVYVTCPRCLSLVKLPLKPKYR